MLALAEICRRSGPASRTKFADRMPPSPLAAMQAIERCRTEALGGHVSPCPAGGDLEYRYHSGKTRHCPKCPHEATTHGLAQQRMRLAQARLEPQGQLKLQARRGGIAGHEQQFAQPQTLPGVIRCQLRRAPAGGQRGRAFAGARQ